MNVWSLIKFLPTLESGLKSLTDFILNFDAFIFLSVKIVFPRQEFKYISSQCRNRWDMMPDGIIYIYKDMLGLLLYIISLSVFIYVYPSYVKHNQPTKIIIS